MMMHFIVSEQKGSVPSMGVNIIFLHHSHLHCLRPEDNRAPLVFLGEIMRISYKKAPSF